MKQNSWKLVIILAILIVAIIFVIPTIKPSWWPYNKINLGLDLQGGMQLTLEVETQKAIENRIDRIIQEFKEMTRKDRIRRTKIQRIENNKISISVTSADNIKKFKKLIEKEFQNLRTVSSSDEDNTLHLVMDLPDAEANEIKNMATSQALETIRNRIDQFGVSEPDIRRQGKNRILVQLPGIKDTKRAKDLIGRTALLEFKLVNNTHDLDSALNGKLPRGFEILYQIRENKQTNRTDKVPYLVKKRAALTGSHLTNARVRVDSQNNYPYVAIEFDRKGSKSFERVTGENVGKLLAIVLDNKIYSAPRVNEKISGGSASISGTFSHEEARDLAIALRAGALPAPIKVLEERTVGPSLGAESINKGLISMLVGSIIVIAFMIIYYKMAGVIADFALIANLLLIAGALAAFGATLTLPGIAGIILTIGMAVDANVLIFERIREEITLGKTPQNAVSAGYDRATLTILDANVTTLIAALVLFQFGTGPIKGFAVTLSLGVVASLFTSLFLTRYIFDFILTKKKVRVLSI